MTSTIEAEKNIFWKSLKTKNKEPWDDTKLILAKEINRIMPGVGNEIIILNIERVHRAPSPQTPPLPPPPQKKKTAASITPLDYYKSLLNLQNGAFWSRLKVTL